MLDSLVGGISVWPFHRIGTRRDSHLSIGGVPGDSIIDRLTVIGTIGRELSDRHVDLVEQRFHLRGVACILVRHDVSDDFAAVGIHRQMQLASITTEFDTMFLLQPLASAVDL